MFYEVVIQPVGGDESVLFWGTQESCAAYEANELSDNNPDGHPHVIREVTHDL